jgi:anti-sigma regulatory factor (Ser/Thr protein kinase)
MVTETLQRHSLKLASSEAASAEAAEWARALAEAAGLSGDRVYALDLSIVELVTNIWRHSYRGQPGEILLELELGSRAAIVTLVDQGPAFDPLSRPAHVKPRSLEEAQVGGLGVHLVRSLADDCRYERRDGSNVFKVYFGAAAPPEA